MALASVNVILLDGGLSRPLPGEDNYSGLLVYLANADLPAGFTTTDRMKQVGSIEAAEALGFAKGSATTGKAWLDIRDYFDEAPGALLWVGCFLAPVDDAAYAAYAYGDATTLQNFTDGKIRRFILNLATPYAAAILTSLKTLRTALATAKKPATFYVGFDYFGVSDITAAATLTGTDRSGIHVVLAMDGSGDGYDYYTTYSESAASVGKAAGSKATGLISNAIWWVANYNLADNGLNYQTPAFPNGVLVRTLTDTQLGAIADKGYIVLRKHANKAGTYWADSNGACPNTTDLAVAENAEVYDKASRLAYAYTIDFLGGPVTVDATSGELEQSYIDSLENAVSQALQQMSRESSISGFQCLVPPDQDVLTTGIINVNIGIVPVGSAKTINLNLGFRTRLSA